MNKLASLLTNAVLIFHLPSCSTAAAQTRPVRIVSGTVITSRNEVVPGVSLTIRYNSGEQSATSDADGKFHFSVPAEPLSLKIEGKLIISQQREIGLSDPTEELRIEIEYAIPPIHESVVIVAAGLDPNIERRNDTIYRNTLFGRDDQLVQTLNAGINVGQHEGGGKSLEIRRFGYNLDHGGINGGLKVLVDDIQQNQATQGTGKATLAN